MNNQATVLEDETPKSEGILSATGEKQTKIKNMPLLNEAAELELNRHLIANVQSHKRNIHTYTPYVIGTWNVQNMDEKKLEMIKQTMEQINIAILGVSEVNWLGSGRFQSDNLTVFYSGNDRLRKNGVAFIVRQDIAQAVWKYKPKSDRIISVRLQGQPTSITVIQVCAPGSDAAKEETESFYASVQEEVDLTPKQDVLLIIGDWNAKVGDRAESKVVGSFGLGVRNEAGERLIKFCGANDLFIANTWFMQHKRRLYTWASPDGQHRDQIAYIIGRRRWRCALLSAKTRPGADCGSDHRLLVATIELRLWKDYQKQYKSSKGVKCPVNKMFALENSVKCKQEEQLTETRDARDTGSTSSTGPVGDQSELAVSLETKNQDLHRDAEY